MIEALRPEEAAALGRRYLEAVVRMAPAKARIVDKMPANFYYLGLIHILLPNARIIHARRDAMDTCFSCYTKLFAGEQRFSYDLVELGRFYKTYEKLTAGLSALLPADRYLEVRYEDVVADLEKEARRMVAFLGLDWDAACLSFDKTSRRVKTASYAQVRRPIYRTSIGRWRSYAEYLRPLSEALGYAE